jgi:hypothetical protein
MDGLSLKESRIRQRGEGVCSEFESKKRIEANQLPTSQWIAETKYFFESRKKAEDMIMEKIRVIAIPTKVVESVRETMLAPGYGFPAHAEFGTYVAPCRHCLRWITPGVERRILFTYDRFTGVESLPLPGSVFIHAERCQRFPENGGFPDDLRACPSPKL